MYIIRYNARSYYWIGGILVAKTQIISAKDAAAYVKDGMTVMLGGFMGNGSAHSVIDEIVASGVKDLTVICNDSAFPDFAIGKMLAAGQVKHLIASFVGLNKIVADLTNSGKMELTLVPQGTLAERIRAAGAGLGAVVTPTGVNTPIEEGKEKIMIDGIEYLLEMPLRADVAICQGYVADEKGNITYRGSTRNFNPTMATAADIVIFEVEEIREEGGIGPDHVETPHIYVDYLVKKED